MNNRLKATLALEEPVDTVRGVSAARSKELHRLNIYTLRDLLEHFPRRYLDMSEVCTISGAKIGKTCTIKGRIYELKLKRPRINLPLVEITMQDKTGVMIITAFRQPWLMNRLQAGQTIAIAGKVTFDYGYKRMTNPTIEVLASSDELVRGAVIPVHKASNKLTPAQMRRLISNALENVSGTLDPVPLKLRQKYRLMGRQSSLSCVHFPENMDEAREARRRLKYEELLMLQLFLLREGNMRADGVMPVQHVVSGRYLAALRASLPFDLTDEQNSAVKDLLDAMAANSVANHMILGDVGCGKTIVATFGLAAVADTGTQALFLAPTELLATQHEKTIGGYLDSIGVSHALLTGSTDANARDEILSRLSSGDLQVLIGTHALLEDDVVVRNLSFVVIDEQQRFGVEQRAKLLSKGTKTTAPDALFLTATPIPRSLALALFGNLTLSYIKERPIKQSGRKTKVLQKKQRGVAYDGALSALARGEQVYVVCPLIGINAEERKSRSTAATAPKAEQNEEDEVYHPEIVIENDFDLEDDNIAAATKEAKFLSETIFPDFRVELLHGGLSSAEKRNIMDAFSVGEIDVLVTTTVIEVGVDVANATCMIIEDADRFGLSQLHQLRGRVGRGDKPGEVFLISATTNESAIMRLSSLEQTEDGFKLAEYDLKLRREGDILGNRQSGTSTLKLVNVITDGPTIEAANKDAKEILSIDPNLEYPEHAGLKHELDVIFSSDKSLIGG